MTPAEAERLANETFGLIERSTDQVPIEPRPTPTVETAPGDVEEHIMNAMLTWPRERAISNIRAIIAECIADGLLTGEQPTDAQLARYRYVTGLDVSMALAEHTASAIDKILGS